MAKDNPSARQKKIGRRVAIAAGVAAGAYFGGRFALDRIARPAPPDGPLSTAAKHLMARCWKGLDPARVLDCHVHVVGLGVGGTGCWVSPRMQALSHPMSYLRFQIYRRAAGIDDMAQADQQYVARLAALARAFQPHGKLLTLAFDKAYREDGSVDDDASEFYVPNDYVLALGKANGDVFVPCASVHPYRKDAVGELARVVDGGARCIKWLPSAQRIDPASERCDAFYAKLKALQIPLLTHAGEEKAVEAEEAQKLCNPLRLRRALDAGVKVIVCHCASSGEGIDDDAMGDPKPSAPNVELFLRMMDEERYYGLLFGDISALTQFNRADVLGKVLARTDLHHRLINGSDYPLPAINALVRTGKLESLGLLDPADREALNEIDRHNPLAFDFCLKRSLVGPKGERFADEVFMPPETLFGSA